MSELNHYARELDQEVVNMFRELTKAETRRKSAESEMRAHPVKEYRFMDRKNSEELQKALNARKAYYKANDEYQSVRRKANDLENRFYIIRENLEKEIAKGKPVDCFWKIRCQSCFFSADML